MGKENEEIIFVTNDTRVHKKGKLDKTDLEILKSTWTGEGLITIKSMDQLESLAKGLVATFEHYERQCKELMTKDQADFIRKLRVEEGYSWRSVARRCYGNHRFRDWPRWEPESSQPMGMALCERAAEFFHENYREPPWN